MARLPTVPENYFVGGRDDEMQIMPDRGDQKPEMKPLPLARDDEAPTISDMLYRYPQPPRGTALSLFMEPDEIASIPGLPDHVYEGLGGFGRPRVQQEADAAGTLQPMAAGASPAAEGQPAGYVSDLDKVSLTPPDWSASGIDLSKPASAGPKSPIGPVRGYPEDGKHAWRADNDDAIVAAVKKYNGENGYRAGDQEYMTPQLMKSWMMRESGGVPQAFRTDPFQVNNPGDWTKGTNEKTKIGLSRGQVMTPEASADAALKWLKYKGHINTTDKSGRWTPYYQGHYEALKNYNAKPLGGLPNGVEYANAVLNNAWSSYGDWQN